MKKSVHWLKLIFVCFGFAILIGGFYSHSVEAFSFLDLFRNSKGPNVNGKAVVNNLAAQQSQGSIDRSFVNCDGEEQEIVSGRILIKFNQNAQAAHQNAVIRGAGGLIKGEIGEVKIIELPPQANMCQVLRALRNTEGIDFVEFDNVFQPGVIPNDPQYSTAWHLSKISTASAWDRARGNGIVIAILDTGVDCNHPDLASKCVPGWNVISGNTDTADIHGHGTMVAGTAAAVTNNGVGVAAPGWDARIMPVRISNVGDAGCTSATNIANGLRWAADHGARVASISYAASMSSTVRNAAQYFQSRTSGVVDASSGNQATFYPDADNPYIITVGATDSNDNLASFSNTGNNIDVVAPGVGIKTTTNGGGYSSGSGTSFSAPVVAGVVALVLSANPSLTSSQVQDIIKQSVDDRGSAGWDTSYGWGRVNAAKAVCLASTGSLDCQGGGSDYTPPSVSLTSPLNGATVSEMITISATASDNVGVSRVEFKVDNFLISSDTTAPYSAILDTNTLSNGVHTISAIAFDSAGNQGTNNLNINVENIIVPDTEAPTVTITSPPNNAVLSTRGNTIVSASANDNVGVARIEIYFDNALKATCASAVSCQYSFNAKKVSVGTHMIRSSVFDAAGNTASDQISVRRE